jgi:hypothetical protein
VLEVPGGVVALARNVIAPPMARIQARSGLLLLMRLVAVGHLIAAVSGRS